MDSDEDSRTPAEEPAVSEPTDLPEHSGSRWEPRAEDDGPAEAVTTAAPGADHDPDAAAPSRRRGWRVAAVAGAAVLLAGGGFGAGFAVGHSGPDGGPGVGQGVRGGYPMPEAGGGAGPYRA